MHPKIGKFALFIFLVIVMTITACTPQASSTPETAPPTSIPATSEPTQPPPTDVPTVIPTQAPPSKVGGTFVMAVTSGLVTLDIQKSVGDMAGFVHQYINGTLITKDKDGNFIPYLAESWTVTPDGLVYTFKIRQDVVWHNGDPMTANDWVYTFQRAMTDEIQGVIKSKIGALQDVTALDDYTLQITLSEPLYPFLYFLTSVWSSPVQQRAIEAMTDTNAFDSWVGVGPFIFKEYQTDEKIVMERNPDYTWGPDYGLDAGPGPYNIQTLEVRIIPEYATIVAGLEAGEIDYAVVQPIDVPLVEENFNIIHETSIGLVNVSLNCQTGVFTDVLLRRAVNYATDRAAIVQIAAQGNAVEIRGPLSPSVVGYWAGIEEIGYGFDLEKAKALVAEAGYTLNADGIAEKDGVLLQVTLDVPPDPLYVNTAQLLQQQWREIGVDLTIQQDDWGVLIQNVLPGNYTAAIMDYGDYEADFLYGIFISTNMDIMDVSRVDDPTMDELLKATRTTVDPAARQQAVNDAMTYIVENAYLVPIMARQDTNAIAKRIIDLKGTFFTGFVLSDAYFEQP
jgi:peptide/nickel transport system substrate-binding protein